ncbi:hypothetical protein [Helicobacter sp. T3_23-1059]
MDTKSLPPSPLAEGAKGVGIVIASGFAKIRVAIYSLFVRFSVVRSVKQNIAILLRV